MAPNSQPYVPCDVKMCPDPSEAVVTVEWDTALPAVNRVCRRHIRETVGTLNLKPEEG